MSSQHPRLTIEQYAVALAYTASLRSEDPKRKVGAVALNEEGRIIATAYNGLVRGRSMSRSWWDDDSCRRKFVVHAEANLCSLTKRGEVHIVALTTAPCGPCALNLVAHGVKQVWYIEEYEFDRSGLEVLHLHDVEATKIRLPDIFK